MYLTPDFNQKFLRNIFFFFDLIVKQQRKTNIEKVANADFLQLFQKPKPIRSVSGDPITLNTDASHGVESSGSCS